MDRSKEDRTEAAVKSTEPEGGTIPSMLLGMLEEWKQGTITGAELRARVLRLYTEEERGK